MEFVHNQDGDIQIRPLKQRVLRDLYSAFAGTTGRPHSIGELDEGLADALADDDRRIRS